MSSNHRQPRSARMLIRIGLAVAVLAVLAGGTVGGLRLRAEPAPAAVLAPAAASAPAIAPPVVAATPVKTPTVAAPAKTTKTRPATSASSKKTTSTAKPKTGAKAQEAEFCVNNPDRCTGGVPDKKSDQAAYQNDPRSNAEINSDQPLYAPQGVCPGGYARIESVC